MKTRLRFQARVLLPVFVILATLVGFMFWLVNRHFTNQLQTQARQAVETADAAFDYYLEARTRELRVRYAHVSTDIRLRQILQRDDSKTLEFLLKELIDELGASTAAFTPGTGKSAVSAHLEDGPAWMELQPACAPSVSQALQGDFNIATVSAAGTLWEIVSLPVSVSDHPGALTFAHAMNQTLARQIKQITHSEIIFVANGKIVTSTLDRTADDAQLLPLFHRVLETANDKGTSPRQIEPVRLGKERFMALAMPLAGLNHEHKLGYLLLYSSENALRDLHANQRELASASLVGIFLSCGLVWLIVRHVTRPLQGLQSGAEAVGRGDFSQRVPVVSRDEFGELANTFNQMTDNLRTSRAELEQTVERLKTTQTQLVQTEKLASVGEFVAGITHELNNPLTAVVGFAELLQTSNLTSEDRDWATRIVDGAHRCHHIVRSLLSFARKHRPERKLSAINELVENTLNFVGYEFRTSNIQLIRKLDPDLPSILVDPNQLQQVFLNLVQNARQAMEEVRREKRLVASTERAGDKLRVIISDNGPGISPENVAKIFDPFFTTKEIGKGTGLGLSLTYGIIQEHGGSIRVESTPGEGASFIIELPIITGVAGAVATIASPKTHRSADGVGKRILIIDDEDSILDLVQIALIHHGFSVDTASHGEAGLDHIAHQHYDVVVCDWKMPGLDGQQIFERLQRDQPDVIRRLVFMTGDVVNEKTQQFQRDSGIPCIAKPFSLTELADLMKKLTACGK